MHSRARLKLGLLLVALLFAANRQVVCAQSAPAPAAVATPTATPIPSASPVPAHAATPSPAPASSPAAAGSQIAAAISGACEVKLTPAKPDANKGEATTRGGIMLAVKDADGNPVGRKRFFLLEKNIEETGGIDWKSLPARENFYKGASPELLKWLKTHDFDCDTLYCPEYQAEYDKARLSVKEFREAYDRAMAELKNQKLALRWMMVYFPLKSARLEYYQKKKAWLEAAAQRGGKVKSVMTDERGIAFLTDLKPGDYYISNIVPLAAGHVLWNCPVKVGPIPHDKLSSADVTFTAPKASASASK